jgi:two-component system response regulator HydG
LRPTSKPEDIIPLMDHFRKQFIKRHSKPQCNFSPAVTRRFYGYEWPGNIRQLRNFVETMVVLDTDGLLDLNDLPPELSEEDDFAPSTSTQPPVASHGLPSVGDSTLIGRSMGEIERWAIEETLKLTAGNREEAAKILNIGARTLYRKLDKYRQDDVDAKSAADSPAKPVPSDSE